jgi:hypothetical protein
MLLIEGGGAEAKSQFEVKDTAYIEGATGQDGERLTQALGGVDFLAALSTHLFAQTSKLRREQLEQHL